MTREQQGEVVSFIHGKGGWLENESSQMVIIKGLDGLYTTDIERILRLGGRIFYVDGVMKISNWTPDPPLPTPEAPQEMKVRSFRGGEHNLALRVVKDPDSSMSHDHVELWYGGNKLGYMHINKEEIAWWGEGENSNSSGIMRISGNCKDC